MERGMPKIIVTCHCGGTRLELPHAPASVMQCTCTYCTKSGGLWCYYEVDEVRVVSEAQGAIYSPTTPLHEHHFCARCGCTTYGISPAYSLEDTEIPEKKKVGVNAKLFDDYALLVSLPVETIDGRNLW
jgi:hypothetical protein